MSNRRKLNLLSIGMIAVMCLSWIFNIGWIRLILTFLLFPVISAVVFFVGNHLSAKYIQTDKKLKTVTMLSYITFLFPHLLVGDGGDIGEMYMLFGLIQNDTLVGIVTTIGICMFVFHFVILIAQYALLYQYHRAKKAEKLA